MDHRDNQLQTLAICGNLISCSGNVFWQFIGIRAKVGQDWLHVFGICAGRGANLEHPAPRIGCWVWVPIMLFHVISTQRLQSSSTENYIAIDCLASAWIYHSVVFGWHELLWKWQPHVQRPQVYWVNIRQQEQSTSAHRPGPPRCHWRQTGNSWLFLMRTQLLWTKSHPSLSSLWTSRTDSACLLVLLWSRNTKPAWSFLNAHSVRVCLQFCLKKSEKSQDQSAPMRIGFTTTLVDGFEDVEWFGRGPHESYVDRHASARVSLHRGSIQEQTVKYVRPQENGNWMRKKDAFFFLH